MWREEGGERIHREGGGERIQREGGGGKMGYGEILLRALERMAVFLFLFRWFPPEARLGSRERVVGKSH